MPGKLQVQEFIKRLSEGTLRQPLALVGVARAAEGNKGFFFSIEPGSDCWVEVPETMVEQVEYLGQQTCSDQNYPLIRVTFKEPTAKEVAASVFASLLRTTSQTLNPPSPSPTQLRMLPLRPHDFWDTEFAGGGVFAPPADPHGPPHPSTPHGDVSGAEYARCKSLMRLCRQGHPIYCQRYQETCL